MRHLILVGLGLLLGFNGAARAASVYVQYASPTIPATVITDPMFATATQPGIFAEANLAVGSFKGLASHYRTSATETIAYSGADLTLTNSGAAPITIGGPEYPFYVDLTARFTVQPRCCMSATVTHSLRAILKVNDPGCGCARIAEVDFIHDEHWFEGAADPWGLSVEAIERHGGIVSIKTATRSSLAATLWMPVIVLAPGDSVAVHFNLLPGASASHPAFGATTDASRSAYIRLFLPENAVVSTDAGPLPWIGVPEPNGALPLGATGLLGLACWRRRSSASL